MTAMNIMCLKEDHQRKRVSVIESTMRASGRETKMVYWTKKKGFAVYGIRWSAV